MLVGLPASGKSTHTSKASQEHFVYSTDAYIQAVAEKMGKTYNDLFTDTIKTAGEVCEMGLQKAVADGKEVIWDQTNLGVKKRKKIINRMKQSGYTIDCHCFVPPQTPAETFELNRRLNSRPGKNIPDNIMFNMTKSYVLPTLDEGFSSIIFYNIFGEIVDFVE